MRRYLPSIIKYFHCLKKSFVLYSPSHPRHFSLGFLQGFIFLFAVFMVLHFSECHTVKWSLLEVEFFHLVICVSVSSVFLHGSTAHFLCSTEEELTFWTPPVYLYIQLLRSILVVSKVWWLRINLLYTSVCMIFLKNKSFFLIPLGIPGKFLLNPIRNVSLDL